MRHVVVLAAVVAAIALANATPARAQATTTFVSGFGLDTNPCTVAAPCRSFRHAHDQTAAGGQITMLDPAGYGAVTIAKAISIVNDGGGEAGITEPGEGVDAITINAGGSDVVNLRGLTLNGVGTGASGITFNSGGSLNIQDCVIRDFTGAGVFARPATSATVTISDTTVSHNGGNGISLLGATGTTITAYVERVAAINNTVLGFDFTTGPSAIIRGTVIDSVAIGNTSGFFMGIGSGGAVALIDTKAVRNRTVGLTTGSGTTSISQVTLSGNSEGFSISGGTLQTFGDNYIVDTSNSGTLTPIAKQ